MHDPLIVDVLDRLRQVRNQRGRPTGRPGDSLNLLVETPSVNVFEDPVVVLAFLPRQESLHDVGMSELRDRLQTSQSSRWTSKSTRRAASISSAGSDVILVRGDRKPSVLSSPQNGAPSPGTLPPIGSGSPLPPSACKPPRGRAHPRSTRPAAALARTGTSSCSRWSAARRGSSPRGRTRSPAFAWPTRAGRSGWRPPHRPQAIPNAGTSHRSTGRRRSNKSFHADWFVGSGRRSRSTVVLVSMWLFSGIIASRSNNAYVMVWKK